MDWLWLWLMKPLAEALMLLGLVVVIVLIGVALSVPGWVRQAKCEHRRVRETQSCDAICTACGKNLGFIGAWREKHK